MQGVKEKEGEQREDSGGSTWSTHPGRLGSGDWRTKDASFFPSSWNQTSFSLSSGGVGSLPWAGGVGGARRPGTSPSDHPPRSQEV